MKNFKIVLFVVLVVQLNSYAQLPVKTSKYNSNLKTKIVGSPYTQKMFSQAKVGTVEQKNFVRYNVFNDEFEFISAQKDTLILDKIEDFGTIVFTETNKKYQLTTYTNSKNKLFYGYVINLKELNGFILFKKENITFMEEKIAKTSLEVNMPAKFVKSGDTFFLKNKEKGTSEFPENKKGLLKLFPDKKEAIETFLKENKIDFDSESDLIKIIDFIATF
ncbi:MAG: hypothetical protein O9267_09425 [Flavobacterium sp.]|uniref:hypothetical protein n=1 Tax=Flavobacterium sp. TaxID=239 RepID=UPI0022C4E59D|nr:hypothetical protein [Flavobacterium sp.]MCZ8197815.1 hypothetical protein [Flavobacterium sp.]